MPLQSCAAPALSRLLIYEHYPRHNFPYLLLSRGYWSLLQATYNVIASFLQNVNPLNDWELLSSVQLYVSVGFDHRCIDSSRFDTCQLPKELEINLCFERNYCRVASRYISSLISSVGASCLHWLTCYLPFCIAFTADTYLFGLYLLHTASCPSPPLQLTWSARSFLNLPNINLILF